MTPRAQSASRLENNLKRVATRIRAAAEKCGRDAVEIQMLPVSKSQPAQMIVEAIKAGQAAFGENYLQEAHEKMKNIRNPDVEWHFLGTIQSNKTRHITASFAWVHSVDRESIAQRLSRQHPPGAPPLNVCIQVNLNEEKTKSGAPPSEVERLLEVTARLSGIKPRGLMFIPPFAEDTVHQHRIFAQAKSVFDRYSRAYHLDTLSMGMSNDFEVAIEEGATLIRLGTAIFGHRKIKGVI